MEEDEEWDSHMVSYLGLEMNKVVDLELSVCC